jgi:hypothetical protein
VTVSSAAALYPTFRNAILPRALEWSADTLNVHRPNRCGNLHSIFAITVKDEKSRSRFKRKRFPELLNDPQARRVLRDVEVQDPPTVVTDHEEAVEDAKRDRWNSEETHRRNGFPVIAKKREPAFGWPGIPRGSFHPTRNRSFRDIETEHEKLAVNARCSPRRILDDHSEDQLAHFLRSLSSPDRPAGADFGNELPVQPESSEMPPDHRFRSDDDEGLLPIRPDSPSNYPEEPVEDAKAWPPMPPLQYGQLLTEDKVLQEKVPTATTEAKERAEPEQKQVEHI